MSGLRLVPFRQFRQLLEKSGFVWQRCKGSHNIFRRDDGRVIVLPNHGAQVIPRPLTRKILRDMNMDPEEYERLLDED